MRWRFWQHASFRSSPSSVLVIASLSCSCWGLLLKLVEQRGWILSLSFAGALSFGSFFLFYTLLRVPLPQGLLGF